MTKSMRYWPGLQTTQIPIQLNICGRQWNRSIFTYLGYFQVYPEPHQVFSAFLQSGLCVCQWPYSHSRCTSSPRQHTNTHTLSKTKYQWIFTNHFILVIQAKVALKSDQILIAWLIMDKRIHDNNIMMSSRKCVDRHFFQASAFTNMFVEHNQSCR